MPEGPPYVVLAFDPVEGGKSPVSGISERLFRRQLMAMERADARSVPLCFVLAGAPMPAGTAPNVLITFDGGSQSVLTVASEILADAGHTGLVFIATDQIGAPGHLSDDQVRVLLGMGLAVGSMGKAAGDLTSLALPALRRELRLSRDLLSQLVGYEVRCLAPPGGHTDPRLLDEAQRAGYGAIFGRRTMRRHPARSHWGRFSVTANTTPEKLERIVLGERRALWGERARETAVITATRAVKIAKYISESRRRGQDSGNS